MIDFVGLDLIVFHDLPVEHLKITWEPLPKFEIRILEFKEEQNGYKPVTLCFENLIQLKLDSLELSNKPELEITSFDYQIRGGNLRGRMVFLTGFSNPALNLEYTCSSVSIRELAQLI